MTVSRQGPAAQVSPSGLRITEDRDHYYVAIDRDERERAKRIPGRTWNPEIRKWVYPRTAEVYRALLAEFSDRPEAITLNKPPKGPAVNPAKAASPSPRPAAVATPAVSTARAAGAPRDAGIETLESLLREQLRLSSRIQERITQLEDSITVVATSQKTQPPSTAPDTIRTIIAGFEQRLHAILPDSSGDKRSSNKSPEDIIDQWLMNHLLKGTYDDSTMVEVCGHWHLVNDYRSVVDDLEEKLKARLRDNLDLGPGCKKSLHDLINDAFDSQAIDKEQSRLLGAFRNHRNKLSHESREIKSRKYLRYLHALSALALVWSELSKAPRPNRQGGEDDETPV